MSSKRKFKVVYHLNGFSIHEEVFTLTEFFSQLSENNCEEIFYSLDEIIDNVLDLKPAESLFFIPNRDCKTSKAIILRID